VQLQELRPERFKQFLPPGMNLTTRIDAQAEVNGGPNGALQGKLNLDIAPGALQMVATAAPCASPSRAARCAPKPTDAPQPDSSSSTWRRPAVAGRCSGTRSLRRRSRGRQNRRRHHRSEPDLAVRAASAGGQRPIAGGCQRDRHDSKLALHGAIRLENAGAAIPEAGIKLEDLQFAVTSSGQGPLQLSGSLRSKPANCN
jgi:hypothetical protein